MSNGMSVGAQFGAAYLFGWALNKLQNRDNEGCKAYFLEGTIYTPKQHCKKIIEAAQLILENIDLFIKESKRDKESLEYGRSNLSLMEWIATYELRDGLDEKDYEETYWELQGIMVHTFHAIKVLLGDEIYNNVVSMFKMNYNFKFLPEHIEKYLNATYTHIDSKGKEIKTTYNGALQLMKEDVMATAYANGLDDSFIDELEMVRTMEEFSNIKIKIKEAIWEKKCKELKIEEEKWVPLLKKYKNTPKNNKKRRVISTAINRLIKEYSQSDNLNLLE
ncbi:hypothetical protein [Hydrogenimonas thermophila]|uniref:Uncharacterized protein n=1 Tax=Hydrogenimonas thermophila TaxID=223786 RepID=A0A1I5P3Z7_9BACT|nr:hypothetical protein [Hydrogenimonas thermophila]SFP28779.1 hypothetical protein SAMN05216234_11343 [Hydrogenimonas thermophila]